MVQHVLLMTVKMKATDANVQQVGVDVYAHTVSI